MYLTLCTWPEVWVYLSPEVRLTVLGGKYRCTWLSVLDLKYGCTWVLKFVWLYLKVSTGVLHFVYLTWSMGVLESKFVWMYLEASTDVLHFVYLTWSMGVLESCNCFECTSRQVQVYLTWCTWPEVWCTLVLKFVWLYLEVSTGVLDLVYLTWSMGVLESWSLFYCTWRQVRMYLTSSTWPKVWVYLSLEVCLTVLGMQYECTC